MVLNQDLYENLQPMQIQINYLSANLSASGPITANLRLAEDPSSLSEAINCPTSDPVGLFSEMEKL